MTLCRPSHILYTARGTLDSFSFIVALLLIFALLCSQSTAHAQAGRRPGRLTENGPAQASTMQTGPMQNGPGQNGPMQNGMAPLRRGESSIRGRVVYEDSGRPAARARVRLSLSGPQPDFPPREAETLTNERGEFRFDNLAAGRYRIIVDERRTTLPNAIAIELPIPGLTGELDPNEELPEENEKEATIAEVDGTNAVEVLMRVVRPGSISGHVLKANGEPLAGAQVNFMRRREKNGRVVGVYRRSALTDGAGAYRISLPPGSYIVSATTDKRRSGSSPTSVSFPVASLAVTYYPSATSPRSSAPVRVESGGEASGVDLRILDRPMHRISGTATARRDGQPLAGLPVEIVPDDGSGMSLGARAEGQTVETDADGRWTIKDVPDGEYIVTVGPGTRMGPSRAGPGGRPPVPPGVPGGMPPSRRRPMVVFGSGPFNGQMRRVVPKRQQVVVSGADVTDLSFSLSEGGRVSGTIVTEDGSPVPAETVIIQLPRNAGAPSTVQPETQSSADAPPDIEAPRPRQIPRPTPVRPDGSFDVAIVPFGKVRLEAAVPDDKYYVKSMLWNGVDLLREPQEFDGESEVTGLRIILATDSMTLTGHVTSAADNSPLAGAHVVLVPADPSRRRSGGRRLFDKTDGAGSFRISGAPGEYFVYVIPQGGRSLPVKLRESTAPPAKAQRVSLQPSERKSLDIIALGSQ